MKGRLTCSKCGYAVIGPVGYKTYRYSYYECNGRTQIVSRCDMLNVYFDWVDSVVGDWAGCVIDNPDNLRNGLEMIQSELEQANQALFNRLSIIDQQTQEYQNQLD
jgi:hypothetical protein